MHGIESIVQKRPLKENFFCNRTLIYSYLIFFRFEANHCTRGSSFLYLTFYLSPSNGCRINVYIRENKGHFYEFQAA